MKKNINKEDVECIHFINKKVRAERKRMLGNEQAFKRYVIRRAFFVLKKQYRSFNMLNAIANKAIENLTYNFDFQLPFNQNDIDRSILYVFLEYGAKYWIKETGWFGKDRRSDRYIQKFQGEI